MKPNTSAEKKHITVDGVTYNVATGKAIAARSQAQRPSSEAIRHRNIQAVTTADVTHIRKPKPMGIIELPQKKKFRKNHKKAKKKPVIEYSSHGFSWFFGRALVPSGFSASAWGFSVLRGVLSPQAWFLTALPIVILELQNVVFQNINELLDKAHLATQNGQVFHATPAIVGFISLAIIILFIRVLLNSIAMHLRITFLSGNNAKLWPAIKLVLHNSIKILVHGAIQVLLVFTVTLVALATCYWLIITPHGPSFKVFLPYIVGLLAFAWVLLVGLLHAKHWLQTAILSSSIKTNKIQRRSLQVILSFPVKSAVLALISFSLTVGVWAYGLWAALKTIEWMSRPVVPSNLRFTLLISSIFFLVVLVGYLQQSIWAAYSSWVNQQFSPRLFVLASDTETKSVRLWPIWVAIYFVIMAIATISLLIVFVLPLVNNYAINFAAHLPDKIELPRIKK